MKKIISLLLVLAMMITVLTVGITATNAAETATITIYGLDGTTEVKEFNVGDEFTVYTTLDVSASVTGGKVGSVQGTQTYTASVLSLVDEISGQYGEFADLVKVFPVTGDLTMANGAQEGKIVYNASKPAVGEGFTFDSASSQLIVTTYKVNAAGNAEVKNALKNLAADDANLTRIVFEGQVQEGKSFAGKATFTDPTPTIDHAEVRIHSLDGRVETQSFNVGDTFTAYTVLNASSVNNGKIASVNASQRYTSAVLELTNAVDEDGYIVNPDTVFPVMKSAAIGSAKNAGVIKYAGSSTTGFDFNSNNALLIVTTYRVKANGYADITNKMNTLAAADDDLTRIVFNGETQSGMSYNMPASFSSDVPVPTEPPLPPTEPEPTTLKVTIINPDNTKVEKTFNKGDTFTVYTVLNAGTTIASVDGTQNYPTAKLQLTDEVEGEYNTIVDTAMMFPVLGDEAVAAANNGNIQFNATRGAVGGGYAFNSDEALLIVSHYKVLAAGEATVKTTLKTLIKDDAAATKIVFNGQTQSGQSYALSGSFTAPGPVIPTEPGPTEPKPTQPEPTQPEPTTPSNQATVTIYGFDGSSKTKTFNIGDEFTVYTTFDGSNLGFHGFGSVKAEQTFTKSVLQSTDEVDELYSVVDVETMFPIFGDAAVAKIDDGLNSYNASKPGVNKGFVFDNPNALVAVTNYKVVAAGNAEVRNAFVTLAADNSSLTRIVNKGVVQGDYEIKGIASFYDPSQPEPTEPPTEPEQKANVTIYGIDGTTEMKEYSVGETFTVYTTFDASKAAENGMIASISGSQTFTGSILQATDAVDADGIVTNNTAMFPILGDQTVARITNGKTEYNASTPNIGNAFKFDSDKAILIQTNYKVTAAGDAEIRNALGNVAAADVAITRIVEDGVVADGKQIGGKASFTKPEDEPGETYLLGDADNNGRVELIDVTYSQRYMANMSIGSIDENIMKRNGDVDRNGRFESIDITYIQRYLANLNTPYPIGEYVEVQ